MIQFNEDPEYFITRFSKDVQDKFLDQFRIKYGYSGFIPINKAYNEYIKDPYHTHLNSTKWANLTDFATSLESQGLVAIVKEPDMTGTDQVLIRLIDTERDKKEALRALASKESVRELERKREIKDIEKTIKLANKQLMNTANTTLKQPEEVKEQYSGEMTMMTNIARPILQANKPSIFGKAQDDNSVGELLLGKQKKTNIDKLIEHNTSKVQRVKHTEVESTQWVRPKMVVKVKLEGGESKVKGEVIRIISPDKIVVKIGDTDKEYNEQQLSKVLPGEGGLVWIVSRKQIASITYIDLKRGEVSCQRTDSQGNKDKFKVDINDICKINQ